MRVLRLVYCVSGLSVAAAVAAALLLAQADGAGAADVDATLDRIPATAALAVAARRDDGAIDLTQDAVPVAAIVPFAGVQPTEEVSPALASGSDAAGLPDIADMSETITPSKGAASLELAALPDAGFIPDADVSALAPARSLRPSLRDAWAVPDAQWDDHPNGPRWTAAVLSALRGPGSALLDTEPRDITRWCPGYLEATPAQRAAFWTGLISSLAWQESTHQPQAVGGGGQWFGLVQISPGTARWRDCDVGSGEALLNGSANLRCGIRIMAITVERDNVVSEGMGGVAADWGPFHSERKREEMRTWVRDQSYCAAPVARMRPVMRPADLVEAAQADVPFGVDEGFEAATRDASPAAALRPIPRPEDQ